MRLHEWLHWQCYFLYRYQRVTMQIDLLPILYQRNNDGLTFEPEHAKR